MKRDLDQLLNDVSLLLVMTDGSDASGKDALLSLVTDVREQAKKKKANVRLSAAANAVLEFAKNASWEDLSKQIEQFVNAGTAFLRSPEGVTFPNEKDPASAGDSDSSELGENFDPSFLGDFVAKHISALDEVDARIAEFLFTGEQTAGGSADLLKYIKKYLHNIKGDSGSVGLRGVERVTHALEERLQTSSVESALQSVLQYKQWVLEALDAVVQKRSPQVSSDDFLKTFEMQDALESSASPPSPSVAEARTAPEQPNAAHDHDIPASYRFDGDLDIFSEFKSEALDHLGALETVLLERGNALSGDDISTIFRAVHSIKGGSSFFNLLEVNRTSHILENLLDEVRCNRRVLDESLLSLLFSYVDLQKQLMVSAGTAVSSSTPIQRNPLSVQYLHQLERYQAGDAISEANESAVAPSPSPAPRAAQTNGDHAVTPLAVTPAASMVTTTASQIDVKSFVKVDTTRLDRLIDSIGEMVICSSMLIRNCRVLLGENETVMSTTHQVEKYSRELQEIGMSMRLDPIRGLFQKMSRLVWDTSKKLKKEITFTMKGEETELDRTVIERLADPLMHMVRNSVDHGVEMPDERVALGKPRRGTVELSASHGSGSIIIKIQDDGRGLDPQKLIAKAVEKGILPPGANMPPQEAYQLIFAPGFSTAAVVSDVSGRGVGMDVVRNNIESMRGQIRIESEVGKGTTFTIELPLTLAIVDGIEVLVGTEHYIIPTTAVIEFIRPTQDMFSSLLAQGETFYFRGHFLPLIRIGSVFKATSSSSTVGCTVAVVDNAGEQVALLVDEVIGSCQTVIKKIGPMFRSDVGVAGCAIMSNGEIGLIIDIRTLVLFARSIGVGRNDARAEAPLTLENILGTSEQAPTV